jgi:hypothetical protein
MFPDLTAQLFPSIAALIAGLLFQSLLPGRIRMFLIYPLSFALGLASGLLSSFLPFFFGLGMSLRAAIGQYWMCFVLEVSLLIIGFAVSFLI